jgi:hypothetical protein
LLERLQLLLGSLQLRMGVSGKGAHRADLNLFD